MAKILSMPGAGMARLPFPDEAELESATRPPLADAAARTQALDIQRSWIVEAPAGSGKTGLLIQRMLKLLARAEIERPSEVMAITFTRKAAAELKNRVLLQLQAAADDLPLPADAGSFEHELRTYSREVLERDRVAGWHLRDRSQGLNIRTIDSFCAELAGSLPLSARFDGQQTPTENAEPLYREAAERVLARLGGEDRALDAALRCLLLHRDAQVSDCTVLIASMLQDREQWAEFLPLHRAHWDDDLLDGEIRDQLEATLERITRTAVTQVHQAMPPELNSELTRLAAELHVAGSGLPIGIAVPPGSAAEDLPHWLSLAQLVLTKTGQWRTRLGDAAPGVKLSPAQKTRLQDLVDACKAEEENRPGLAALLHALRALPPMRYPETQWGVIKALFHVLRYALVELRLLFGARNGCDFTEIALTARTLLKGDCSHTPCLQLSHLLVDEMQDTSAGQYELLEQLTRHWDGFTQTLFLVGDPKQSIYLFRQARVERFLRTQQSGRLGDVPLAPLRLTANFRSQASLVEQFNSIFAQILPAPASTAEAGAAGEVPFVAAVPVRPPGVHVALQWHARPSFGRADAPGTDEDDLTENDPEEIEEADGPAAQQARTLRQMIEDFQQRWAANPARTRLPRIAVLGRTRAHLAPVLQEFHRDRGHGPLPFRAVKIEQLGDRPEVLDLLALTRALLHPADRIAWLAVLRSPVCGLSTADLLALTGEGEAAPKDATVPLLLESRRGCLSAEGQQRLHRILPALLTAQRTREQTSLRVHIERTWRSLGADAFLRAEQYSNALRFLELLPGDSGAGPQAWDLATLERQLATLYAAPAEGAAVELMTIHHAKGLEWDLVLLPALEGAGGRSSGALLQWLELDDEETGEAEVLLAPIQSKGEDASAMSRWLGRARREREMAEAKRLLYVACTRAREELHLFATCRITKNGELETPAADSLLRAAWPAAEGELRQQLLPAAPPRTAGLVVLSAPAPQPESREPLRLAASAEDAEVTGTSPEIASPRQLARLPSWFDPLTRFQDGSLGAAGTPRTVKPPLFDRPEGSFAARAFGNVVHRFLEQLSTNLEADSSAGQVLDALPGWRRRIHTQLRAEGLAPAVCDRQAERVEVALGQTLQDPIGRWLLTRRAGAGSEVALSLGTAIGEVRQIRADRMLVAGAEPLSDGTSHLWIVDFKTTERGGYDLPTFLEQERTRYAPQLETYARAAATLHGPGLPIVLALYFPLIPQMLHWLYHPLPASHQ